MSQDNPVKFEATPTLVNNVVSWKLCLKNPPNSAPEVCGDGSASAPFPNISLDQNKPNYTLQFKIVNDNTQKNIQFATDALSIKKGEPVGPGLPKQIGGENGNGTKLFTFTDANSLPNNAHPTAVTISYGLNFTDKDGNAVTSIDPDITNGGTNRASFADYLLPVAVAFAAGILFTLLLRKLTVGRFW